MSRDIGISRCPGSHDIPALRCPGSRGTSGCATCRDIPMLSRHNIKLKLVRPGYRTRHVPKLYFLRTFLYDKGTLRVLLQYPGICRDMQNSMSRDIGTWPGHGTSGHGISTCPGSRRDMGHWDPGPGRHNYTTLVQTTLMPPFTSALRRRFRRLFVEDGTHFFAVLCRGRYTRFRQSKCVKGSVAKAVSPGHFPGEHAHLSSSRVQAKEACSSQRQREVAHEGAVQLGHRPRRSEGRARPGLLLPLGCPSAPRAAPQAALAGAAPPRPSAAVAAARGLRFLRGAASRLSPSPRVPTFASSVAAGAVAGATAAALTTALTCSNPCRCSRGCWAWDPAGTEKREEGCHCSPLPPLRRDCLSRSRRDCGTPPSPWPLAPRSPPWSP